jgi:hypothetical protein
MALIRRMDPCDGRSMKIRAVIALMAVLAFAETGCSLNQGAASPASASLAAQPAPVDSGRVITITGHGLLSLSETQFRFAAADGTYTVVMDLSTKCVNLRGKLLGGYQLVSRILMATALPLTITGPVDGLTIRAQTVLIPNDKDALA